MEDFDWFEDVKTLLIYSSLLFYIHIFNPAMPPGDGVAARNKTNQLRERVEQA